MAQKAGYDLQSVMASLQGRAKRAVSEAIFERSQELVPIATGELYESGHIEERGKFMSVVYDAPHALYVHEEIFAHHENGQAKFLETAVNEVASNPGRVQWDKAESYEEFWR